ncbi:hypothetical protein [Vibrio vulnificus YJ016]|uniref:Uncharacterized protein n=1 Tax=Vibrio vulnificus (strain YJ016) TaxID=196600 RepID=Q7MFZ9_VIBVY|nr:hypothetical protein [Vibrio vulnificus YJ016]
MEYDAFLLNPFFSNLLNPSIRWENLSFEHVQLVWHAIPLFRFIHCWLHFGLYWPELGQFRIQLFVDHLIFWQLIFLEDCRCGTLVHTQTTVDALDGVDHHEVRPFVKGIRRANGDTIRVFTLDTVISYHKCHDIALFSSVKHILQ